jgi:hypothetical protein
MHAKQLCYTVALEATATEALLAVHDTPGAGASSRRCAREADTTGVERTTDISFGPRALVFAGGYSF